MWLKLNSALSGYIPVNFLILHMLCSVIDPDNRAVLSHIFDGCAIFWLSCLVDLAGIVLNIIYWSLYMLCKKDV